MDRSVSHEIRNLPVQNQKLMRVTRFASLATIYENAEECTMDEVERLSKETAHPAVMNQIVTAKGRGAKSSNKLKCKNDKSIFKNKKVMKFHNLPTRSDEKLVVETCEAERDSQAGMAFKSNSSNQKNLNKGNERRLGIPTLSKKTNPGDGILRIAENELNGKMKGTSSSTKKGAKMEIDRPSKGKEKLLIPDKIVRENVQKTNYLKESVSMSAGVKPAVTSLSAVPLVTGKKVTSPGPSRSNSQISNAAVREAFPGETTISRLSVCDGPIANDSPMSGISTNSCFAAVLHKHSEVQMTEMAISKALGSNPKDSNYVLQGPDRHVTAAKSSRVKAFTGGRRLKLLGKDIYLDAENQNMQGSNKVTKNVSTEGSCVDISLGISTGSDEHNTNFQGVSLNNSVGATNMISFRDNCLSTTPSNPSFFHPYKCPSAFRNNSTPSMSSAIPPARSGPFRPPQSTPIVASSSAPKSCQPVPFWVPTRQT